MRATQTVTLMSAAKFREFAEEHLDWAKTAKSEGERQTFEQMARAWEMLLGVRWKQVERRLRREPLERARINAAHSTRRD